MVCVARKAPGFGRPSWAQAAIVLVLAGVLAGGDAWAHAGESESTHPAPSQPALLSPGLTADAAQDFARQVVQTADHAGLPFAVVDKTAAVLTVYRGDGSMAGSTPVLLGLAPGDGATHDVGLRTQTGRLRAVDRTTPAGRFDAEPGRNLKGEAVVWIDYDKALAIHRLRPGTPQERRAERLASPTPSDNRISAGCVVVPVAFYDKVVDPVLGRGRSVVYVMAEDRAGPGTASGQRLASLR